MFRSRDHQRRWQRKLALFSLMLFTCSLLITPPSALAALDPNPPVYDTPPGPPLISQWLNLPSSPIHQKFGIAAHPWWLDLFLDQFVAYYKDLHVTSVRLPIEWKTLQSDPGVLDWRLYDRLLNRLSEEGFEVIGEFVTIPYWISNNRQECLSSDLNCGLANDPETRQRFSEMVDLLARRYPAVRYWEFWNEPEYWPHMGMRDIGDYAPWLRLFYDTVKKVDPTLIVAANSVTGPAYFAWLYQYSDDVWGPSNRPFDALSYHPYNTALHYDNKGRLLGLDKGRIDQLRLMMVEKGDANKPIWITEIGWETKNVSPQVASDYLGDAFDFISARSYITFVQLHMLHDWTDENYGLLRTIPNLYQKGPLTRDTKFEPKQPYYDTYKFYNKRPDSPLSEFERSTVLGFPETKHTVREAFKTAWARGSLALFGYPRTGQFYERNPSDGRFYLVQYFERVRMEYHPEYAGTPNEILFGLLGNQLLYERGWLNGPGEQIGGPALPEPMPKTILNPGTLWFPQTHHMVSGLFLDAWNKQGGLTIVGLPKTGVFEEVNPDDGQRYPVQYFERARMELHPAQNGQVAYISFGLLGNDRLRLQGHLDKKNQPILTDYYNTARPEFS